MSGSKAARLKAEEEANALIAAQSQPTHSNVNTGQETNQPTENGTPVTTDSEEKTWEAKYKVLQGKYNAEVAKVRDENATLKQQLEQASKPDTSHYESEIAALKQQVESLQANSNVSSDGEVDDYLREEYGDDFANAIARMIDKRNSGANVEQFKQQLDTVQQQTAQTSHEMRLQTLKAMLNSKGVNFEQVDTDPLFHDWLAIEDGTSGQSRAISMRNAFANNDLERASQFYIAYKSQERSSFESNPLSNHVDVSPTQPGESPSNVDAEVWTSQMVDALYADYRAHKISEQDFKKYEQSLERAIQSGNFRA